jgi:hypothetical protein
MAFYIVKILKRKLHIKCTGYNAQIILSSEMIAYPNFVKAFSSVENLNYDKDLNL